VLSDEKANSTFHLMIIELERQRHLPALTDREILFAYGTAATTGILLGTSNRNDCIGIIALMITQRRNEEISGFFGVVVDQVLPLDAELEVRRQASAQPA
jgi:hypothetical protein